MKKERFDELQRTGDKLEPEEMRAGWHYCSDFDQDLTRGDERGEGTKCCWCGFDGSKFKATADQSSSQTSEGRR